MLSTRIWCCAHLIILMTTSTNLHVDYHITIMFIDIIIIIITNVDINRTTIVRYRIRLPTWATKFGVT